MSEGANYAVIMAEPNLSPLGLLDKPLSINATAALNEEGWFTLAYPYEGFDPALLVEDALLRIIRLGGDYDTNIFTGLLKRWQTPTDELGKTRVILEGPGLNHILSGRIVAYKAGSAQALKTSEQVGDMALQAARENLGASAVAARDLSAWVTIPADANIGPTGNKAFAYQNLLEVFRELSNYSRSLDSTQQLYYQVVINEEDKFELALSTGFLGQDLRQALTFGLEFGNLKNPNLIEDYYGKLSTVFVGGPGERGRRIVIERNKSSLLGSGPFGRREAFVDARDVDYGNIANLLDARGDEAIAAARPRRYFAADILSVPGARFGRDWGLGDLIAVNYLGQVYEGIINKVVFTLDGLGKETITGAIEYQEAIIA